MACFNPVAAWQTADGAVMFSARQGADRELKLPCGNCVGCRIARARSWSLRCVHEASLHKENSFLTLTYSPDHLPPDGSLRYRDFQLFMKRLRKATKRRLRYFVCGEYGESFSRPHYHACLFGYGFPDREPVSLLGKDSGWRSSELEAIWGLGHVHIHELNQSTAGYAARYILKKVVGAAAEKHYERVDRDGVVVRLAPEFARMSLKPGVGAGWYAAFRDDAFNRDSCVSQGAQFPVPKYYDKLLERDDPDRLARIKEDRESRALKYRGETHPARLAVREEVERAKLKTRRRKFEE